MGFNVIFGPLLTLGIPCIKRGDDLVGTITFERNVGHARGTASFSSLIVTNRLVLTALAFPDSGISGYPVALESGKARVIYYDLKEIMRLTKVSTINICHICVLSNITPFNFNLSLYHSKYMYSIHSLINSSFNAILVNGHYSLLSFLFLYLLFETSCGGQQVPHLQGLVFIHIFEARSQSFESSTVALNDRTDRTPSRDAPIALTTGV